MAFAAAFATLLGATGATHAESIASGILQELGTGPNNLTFNGNSRFGTVSDGGDGTLDVGDRLNGQFVVRNIIGGGGNVQLGGVDAPPSTSVDELTGIIEIEVKSKTGSAASGYTFEFGAFTSGTASIVNQAGNPTAIIALYQDSNQNGMLSGLPIPDPTLVDGQLYGYLGLGTPGDRRFTVQTVAGANGQHSDASSAAGLSQSLLVSTGDVSLNLIDQAGAAITDETVGDYTIGTNSFGTQFAGSLNFFGGAGTGADFAGDLSLTANIDVSAITIIPLPPAALAAIPGLLMVVGYAKRRRAV